MIARDDVEVVLVWGQEPPPRRRQPSRKVRVPGRPQYATIHTRLRRERGPARVYRCVDCGGQAEQWSYDGLDPDERVQHYRGQERKFSVDLGHYHPRCVGCHMSYDRFGSNGRWEKRASEDFVLHLTH